MKRFMALPLSLLLATSLLAAPAPQATSPKKKAASKRAPASTVTKDITDLKQALDAQQQQIQQLRQDLQTRDQAIQQLQQRLDQNQTAATDAQGKADAAAAETAKQEEAVTALKGDVVDMKQNSANTALTLQETQKDITTERGEIKALSSLKITGDLRLRFEPFFGGGPANGAASADRFRERYRLRLNINTKVANDFAVGLSFASGDLGDPVSTNSTQTGFYTRKPFAVDKAFGTYTPHSFKPLTVTAGKF